MTTPRRIGSVLVVDDHPAVRTSIATLLRDSGYQVVEAEDGFVALRLLRELSVSVVVLDLAMPVLDGFALLDKLEDPPPPWVIVYSAFELYSVDELNGRFKDKVFRALRKPIPAGQLVVAVAEAMDDQLERLDRRV